jgi:DNA-binding XRE family transcriptional regulator
LSSLTSPQCRAARGLLDWSQLELAERSDLSESTVRDFEKGRRTPSQSNLDAIQRAFEDAGIEFISGNQHGVRMRKMKTGDYVKFRKGVMFGAPYGDAVGVILRDRPEVKMGSVERVDVVFPGHKPLLGIETALFELFVPPNNDPTVATCSTCGLQVRVKSTETQIDYLKYIANCKRAEDRPAFDLGCPDLRKAVSAAHQLLRSPVAGAHRAD